MKNLLLISLISVFTPVAILARPMTPIPVNVYVLGSDGDVAKVRVNGRETTIPKKSLKNCKLLPAYCKALLSWEEYSKFKLVFEKR